MPVHLPKRTCRPSSVEPDVVIVVGGVEYHEHSSFLCSWSGYFDGALRSGMKESESKRFEFPGRMPEEWEFVVELAAPSFARKKSAAITVDNVHTYLSWFSELCCVGGLEECDYLLTKECIHKVNTVRRARALVCKVLFPAMEVAFLYNLPVYQRYCLVFLKNMCSTCLCYLEKQDIQTIASYIKEYAICRDSLWDSVKKHLPATMTEKQKSDILEHDLLPEVLALKLEADKAGPF